MKIPRRLRVGGHVYQVLRNYVFTERSDLVGQADHSTGKIRLSAVTAGGEARPASTIEETFFHELLHCVNEVYNAHALDEAMLTRLSEGLYAVLSNNGMFRE